MRPLLTALVALSTPALAFAAPACPAPEPIAPTPLPGAGAVMPPTVPAAEIAASPALRRIVSHGAVLYRLPTEHGLHAVFARSGSQFRVFYLTPDDQAEIGGVMWDAAGHNITRSQVAAIPGTVPTVHWAPATAPSAGVPATQPPGQAATDPVARLAAAHFGLEGRDGAPRVYMLIDPLCPFSTRAFSALAPYTASGRLQLALVPVSINDHENNGASTPAALELLSADPHAMGDVWRHVSGLGHADMQKAPSPVAQAALTLNLSAAHAIGMRGTPTLVWKDRTGAIRQEAGTPDDLNQFLASLPS